MNRWTKLAVLLVAITMMVALRAGVARAAEDHAGSAAHAADKAIEGAAARAVGEAGGHESGDPTPLKGVPEGLITGITTVVVFLLLLFVLGKFAWGPISKGLEAREDKIRKDIEEAENARKAAEARLAEYDQRLKAAQAEVSAMIAKATQDAERVATNVKIQAQKDAEETKSKALKDIDSAREQAIGDVRAQAAELSTAIASKILKRNINADDQRQLVSQSLDELQTLGNRR